MNYKKLQVRIFVLCWMSYAFFYVSRKNFSIVKTSLHEELGFSMVQLGFIETLYAGCYMAGQFVSGALGDKFGPRRLLSYGMIGSALTSILMGISVSYSIFAFSLAFNGLFQSSGWPNNLKTVTLWFDQKNRGKITGLWCTCYTVGPLMASSLATWLLVSYGWQSAFIYPGLSVAAAGLVIFLFLIDSPRDAGFKEVQRADAHAERKKAPFRSMITHPAIIVYGLSYAFIKFVRYSFTFWMPWYLYEKMNFSKGDAAYISMAFEFGGLLGVIGIGCLSDKYFSENRSRVVILCILALAGSLFLYQAFESESHLLNFILLSLIGFMLFGGDSVLSATATQDIGGNEATASAAGIVNGIGSIGGVMGGLVPAVVAANFGWNALFYLLALSTIFSALLLYYFAGIKQQPR